VDTRDPAVSAAFALWRARLRCTEPGEGLPRESDYIPTTATLPGWGKRVHPVGLTTGRRPAARRRPGSAGSAASGPSLRRPPGRAPSPASYPPGAQVDHHAHRGPGPGTGAARTPHRLYERTSTIRAGAAFDGDKGAAQAAPRVSKN